MKEIHHNFMWKISYKQKLVSNKEYVYQSRQYIVGIDILRRELTYRTPEWISKIRHGADLVPAHLRTLKEDLKQ